MPQFIDYESIADRIYWLGPSVCLNFTVKLGKKDKDGNRTHYHKEFEYNSQYLNIEKSISIKRNFDYYFSIENIYDKSVYIQIRVENMIMLQNVLQQAIQLLFDDNNYAVKNKRLVIKGKINPILLPGLPQDKWISFEPVIIEMNDTFSKGVRITLSDYSKYIDIDIDHFMGLAYILNTFNMYQAAITIINYLNWNEYGTSLVTFDNEADTSSNNEGIVSAMPERKVPKAKQTKSFFDRANDLDNM